MTCYIDLLGVVITEFYFTIFTTTLASSVKSEASLPDGFDPNDILELEGETTCLLFSVPTFTTYYYSVYHHLQGKFV